MRTLEIAIDKMATVIEIGIKNGHRNISYGASL